MALIYAARDEAGGWHGDPDAKIGWAEPKTGLLRIPAEASSPFAGQRIIVWYAAIKGGPGFDRLELEDGQRLYPTVEVEEALFPG